MPKVDAPIPAPASTPLDDGSPLSPYWETKDEHIKLYHGDAGSVMPRLPAKSVHTIVTSPPYYNLRDYKGGVDELGGEKTPEEYAERLTDILTEAGRLLRNDGTLWTVLGDTYGSGTRKDSGVAQGLPEGDVTGIPWLVAFAMKRRGWKLRSPIIWDKPCPLPEPVKTRCTKSYEHIFMFTKSMRYYYDWVAIAEPSEGRPSGTQVAGAEDAPPRTARTFYPDDPGGRMIKNSRDVWRIAPSGWEGYHNATFPPELPRRCIAAGTSKYGCCSICGKPWTRCISETPVTRERPNDYVKPLNNGDELANSMSNSAAGIEVTTITWEPGCSCRADVIPCTVLDPFVGSGTTCYVASTLGRRSIGIDLNADYLRDNAIPRVEGCVYSAGKVEQLPGKEPKALEWLTEGNDEDHADD